MFDYFILSRHIFTRINQLEHNNKIMRYNLMNILEVAFSFNLKHQNPIQQRNEIVTYHQNPIQQRSEIVT